MRKTTLALAAGIAAAIVCTAPATAQTPVTGAAGNVEIERIDPIVIIGVYTFKNVEAPTFVVGEFEIQPEQP